MKAHEVLPEEMNGERDLPSVRVKPTRRNGKIPYLALEILRLRDRACGSVTSAWVLGKVADTQCA